MFPTSAPFLNFWPFWGSAEQFDVSVIVSLSFLSSGFISYGSIFRNFKFLANFHLRLVCFQLQIQISSRIYLRVKKKTASITRDLKVIGLVRLAVGSI